MKCFVMCVLVYFYRSIFVSMIEHLRPLLVVRSIWSKTRSSEWWFHVSCDVSGEAWWWENLRMSKDTFNYLCRELRPHISKKHTHMREPVSVERRVAITLWKLATNIEYRSISQLFGLGRSTVCTIVLETCRAITEVLLPRYVKVPQGESCKEAIDGFDRLGFPQAVGAVDGTHIPIIRPVENATDYYNRKGFHSIIMQGVVDYRGIFIDVYIGWPGRVHDARVFKNSGLFKKASRGQLLPDWPKYYGHVKIPLLLLGDPAYPLLPWLMKPYTHHVGLSPKQKNFNRCLSKARVVVEQAFGRLKGRWRCLLKRMDHLTENVPYIVSTCVTLHNVCELFGDNFHDDWEVSSGVTEHHHRSSSDDGTGTPAERVRKALEDYLFTH